jgi:hypothetical protein
MPIARIAESIIAEVRPAKKIDRIRNIWSDVKKLRAARLTYKQIVAQLPKFGIDDISLTEFHSICYRIRQRPPVADEGSGSSTPPHTARAIEFDPLADAKRRRDEKTRPIFQQRKEI